MTVDASRGAPNAHTLAALRHSLTRLHHQGRPDPGHLVLGPSEIHGSLGGSGLLCGALHEVLALPDDRPAALGFVLALAAQGLMQRSGLAMLVMARRTLADFGRVYGRGLHQLGVESRSVFLIDAASDKDALWALEEVLRSETKPALVAGSIAGGLDSTGSRRLSLAAARSGAPLVLMRAGTASGSNTAATRWSISSAPARRDRFGTILHARWRATLQRCRKGRPGEWVIEWDHVAHCFRLAEGLADRPAAAGAEFRRAS